MSHAVSPKTVAYFSMEISIVPELPTYSGGLGVLAGDTIRAAADLGVPMVAVTLLFRKGYVRQSISPHGEQLEAPEQWEPEQLLSRSGPIVDVPLRDRVVRVQAWKRIEVGVTGHSVPILFLDTDVVENSAEDRRITDSLYGGDQHLRVLQELVLGVGGARILRALGYTEHVKYHMNEGHAAFLLLELVEKDWCERGDAGVAQARSQAVFTTHTPVAAGHDVFPRGLIEQLLSAEHLEKVQPIIEHDALNMTKLALRFSGAVNAVSRKHSDVTTSMFPGSKVVAITNGVHAVRWAGKRFAELFDRYTPGWRERSEQLRHAALIPTEDIVQAHRESREDLLRLVQEKYGMPFGGSGIVIGFARRATEYKRATLLFRDVERLKRMAEHFGPINILFAGKAHPRDDWGKHIIREIHETATTTGDNVRVAFLPNYEVELAAALVSGVDLWLNTPRAPLEASGTSGMKAALNGIPSLSIADGWWLEGGVHGATGWVVRSSLNDGGIAAADQDAADAEALYHQLESAVLPCFFHHPDAWAEVMRNAISINGSFFNTHRMVEQYRALAYERELTRG
jgi:starch phosphorylase